MRDIIIMDLQKDRDSAAPASRLRVRRGDSRSLARTYQILDGGVPVNLADATVTFMAESVAGRAIMDQVDADGQSGVFEYRIPDAVAAQSGTVTLAYFRVARGDEVASTNGLVIEVLDNVDLTDSVTGDYVPMLDRIVESADEMMANAEALKSQALRIIELHAEMAAADDAAEAARVAAEAARATAESARATAEDARAAAESARASAESKRASAETARASAEATRKSAEGERAKAEAARATAEDARENAEQAREVAQDKNNADQAANNAAAQGLVAVILAQGQYDASTLQPTVTGEVGKMYMVPNPDGEGDDTYVEWMRISGRWERIGLSTASVEAVGTSDIDQVASGTQKVGDQLLNLTGLSYLWAKVKAAFAPYSHTHPATSITSGILPIARGGTGAATVEAARASLGAASTAEASESSPGLMSSADKAKLNGIAAGANAYSLPTATYDTRGGVKLMDSTGNASDQSSGWAATPKAVYTAKKEAIAVCTTINTSRVRAAGISATGSPGQLINITADSIADGSNTLVVTGDYISVWDGDENKTIGIMPFDPPGEWGWKSLHSNVRYFYKSGLLIVAVNKLQLGANDWDHSWSIPFKTLNPLGDTTACLVDFDGNARNNVGALWITGAASTTGNSTVWVNAPVAGTYSGTLVVPAVPV